MNKLLKFYEYNFSYNNKLEEEKTFKIHIAEIENVLKIWRMRDLTIEGKIVIFKLHAICKVVYLALIETVAAITAEHLDIIKNNFI